MGAVLVSLLPFIIGSALVPLQIIIVILLLKSEKRGPAKAIAFVTGMTLARLVQGVLFGFVFTEGEEAGGSAWIKSTLLLVLGILLLITAYKKWVTEPDPDAPPPKWLTTMDTVTPGKALVFGAGLIFIAAKLWVFTLGALSVITDAGLGQPDSSIAYLLYILLAQSLLIIPILIRLIVPAKAVNLLGTFGDWLDAHNTTIVIAVSLVFGLLFLYQGLTGLLGSAA